MKFYPRDWRGDQALRAVSLTARGLWMECLCLMHEAEPRGHLLLNGKKVAVDTLARMVGASSDEVSAAMQELQSAGVFTLAKNGVVTSRRMIQDEKAAKEGSKAVRKRWEQAAENKRQSADPNRSVPRGATAPPSTQRPESRKNTFPLQQQLGGESEGGDVFASPGVPSRPFDRSASDLLEAKLREAAGYQQNPAPNLLVVGPIEGLIAEGFDLDGEILPTVRAKAMAMAKPAQSWAFFVPVVREARDKGQRNGAVRSGGGADMAADLERARQRVQAIKRAGGEDGR